MKRIIAVVLVVVAALGCGFAGENVAQMDLVPAEIVTPVFAVESTALANRNGEVTIKFTEQADFDTATDLANYTCPALDFVSATLSEDSREVVLKVMEMEGGRLYSVNVKNVMAQDQSSTVADSVVRFGGYDYVDSSIKKLVMTNLMMMNTDGTIDVRFSHELDASAIILENFVGTVAFGQGDSYEITQVELSSDKKGITVYTSGTVVGNVLKLEMINLKTLDEEVTVEASYSSYFAGR